MRTLSSVVLAALVSGAAFAQPLLPASTLRFLPDTLDLGAVDLGVLQQELRLVNTADVALELRQPFALGERVLALDSPLSIPPHDTLEVLLQLDLDDDIDLDDVLLVESPQLFGPASVPLRARPRSERAMWRGAANLWGGDLVDELASTVAGQTVYSYSAAREHMFGDYDNVDGSVQCVYTGAWIQTSGIPDPNTMNCEHTWPQSMGAEGDARSDMHHLYPTLNSPNSIRGNLPFGDVVVQNWEQGGSQRGADAGGVTVFEPRDVHKGDCARSMFYFALRYDNPSDFLNFQEATLRAWSEADTVSLKERDRNDAIEALQHNRNPFVDHPGWLRRIGSLSGNPDPPATRLLQLPADTLRLGTLAAADSLALRLPIRNGGNSPLLIGYIQAENTADATVIQRPSSLGSGSTGWIELRLHPEATGVQVLGLLVSSNAQNGALQRIELGFEAEGTAVDPAAARPLDWTLAEPYPNPFNPATTLRIDCAQPSQLRLSVHDLRGALVLERRLELPAGSHRQNIELGAQASGLYLLQLSGENRAETRKLLLAR